MGEIEIIRDVLKLYEYLRINNITVDLVILCNAKYGYAQALGDMLNSMTSSLKIYDHKDQPGIFIIYSYQLIQLKPICCLPLPGGLSLKNRIYFRDISPEARRPRIFTDRRICLFTDVKNLEFSMVWRFHRGWQGIQIIPVVIPAARAMDQCVNETLWLPYLSGAGYTWLSTAGKTSHRGPTIPSWTAARR